MRASNSPQPSPHLARRSLRFRALVSPRLLCHRRVPGRVLRRLIYRRQARKLLHLKIIWCPGPELNQRHRDFQSRALPTEYLGICLPAPPHAAEARALSGVGPGLSSLAPASPFSALMELRASALGQLGASRETLVVLARSDISRGSRSDDEDFARAFVSVLVGLCAARGDHIAAAEPAREVDVGTAARAEGAVFTCTTGLPQIAQCFAAASPFAPHAPASLRLPHSASSSAALSQLKWIGKPSASGMLTTSVNGRPTTLV